MYVGSENKGNKVGDCNTKSQTNTQKSNLEGESAKGFMVCKLLWGQIWLKSAITTVNHMSYQKRFWYVLWAIERVRKRENQEFIIYSGFIRNFRLSSARVK
jgi:hypothetical protein